MWPVAIMAASLAACVISWVLTVKWWTPRSGADRRRFNDFIADIRAMNEYNGRFVEGIVIFLAVALVGGETLIHEVGLVLLLLGFASGVTAMFFLPLPKPDPDREQTAPVGPSSREERYARKYWLIKVLFSQATAILTFSGVLAIMVEAIPRLDL